MSIVLVLKLMTLFFEAFEFHYLKTTGTPHGWQIAYYIFSFLRGMMLFGTSRSTHLRWLCVCWRLMIMFLLQVSSFLSALVGAT